MMIITSNQNETRIGTVSILNSTYTWLLSRGEMSIFIIRSSKDPYLRAGAATHEVDILAFQTNGALAR